MQNNPMMFVRGLKGAPASVLWALVLVRQSWTARELCAYTGYKLDSVREAMQVLAGYNLVVEQRRAHGEQAWSLGEGVQYLLPGIDPRAVSRAGITLPEPEIQADADTQNPIKSDSGDALVIDAEDQNRIKSNSENGDGFQSWKKSDSGDEKGQKTGQNQIKSDSGTGSINLIDDDDEFKDFKDSSSSSIMNPKTEFLSETREVTVFEQGDDEFPSLDVVLASMEQLFGDYLTPELFEPGLSPKLALAWICKAYFDQQRNPKFRNPVGLIRRRLQAREPRNILRLDEMPEDFLETLGLWKGRCTFCGQGFRSRGALNEHLLAGHADDDEQDVDESPDAPDNRPAPDNGVFPLWETVLARLQDEMPRASFDTWVRDTQPRAWDAEARRLVVRARNAYSRDWCEQKLRERVAYLVAELGHKGVKVEFKVF